MVLVWSDVEGNLFLVVLLKEPSELAVVALRDIFEEQLGSVLILVQNGRLVVHDWQEQVVDYDLKVLVHQIQSVLLRVVPKEELLLIGIGQFDHLLANEVEDAALGIGKDEALRTDPETACDDICILLDEVKGLLTPVIVLSGRLRLQVGVGLLRIEVEQVVLLFQSQHNLLPVFRPVQVSRSWTNVDSPHKGLALPIVEGYELLRLGSEESTSKDALHRKAGVERLVLLHVLVDLEHVLAFCFDGKHVLTRILGAPNQVTAVAKRSMSELRERVNHEVSVATDTEVPARGSESHGLSVSLASTEILHVAFDGLSIFELALSQLQVAGLDLRAVHEDHFAVLVSHHGHFVSYLDHKSGLVEADSHVVAVW